MIVSWRYRIRTLYLFIYSFFIRNDNVTGKKKGLYLSISVQSQEIPFISWCLTRKWVTCVNKVHRYVPIDSSTMFTSVTQACVYYGTPRAPRCCMSVGCILLIVDVSVPPNI